MINKIFNNNKMTKLLFGALILLCISLLMGIVFNKEEKDKNEDLSITASEAVVPELENNNVENNDIKNLKVQPENLNDGQANTITVSNQGYEVSADTATIWGNYIELDFTLTRSNKNADSQMLLEDNVQFGYFGCRYRDAMEKKYVVMNSLCSMSALVRDDTDKNKYYFSIEIWNKENSPLLEISLANLGTEENNDFYATGQWDLTIPIRSTYEDKVQTFALKQIANLPQAQIEIVSINYHPNSVIVNFTSDNTKSNENLLKHTTISLKTNIGDSLIYPILGSSSEGDNTWSYLFIFDEPIQSNDLQAIVIGEEQIEISLENKMQ